MPMNRSYYTIRSQLNHYIYGGEFMDFTGVQRHYYCQWRAEDGSIPWDILYIDDVENKTYIVDPQTGEMTENES